MLLASDKQLSMVLTSITSPEHRGSLGLCVFLISECVIDLLVPLVRSIFLNLPSACKLAGTGLRECKLVYSTKFVVKKCFNF